MLPGCHLPQKLNIRYRAPYLPQIAPVTAIDSTCKCHR